jgi:hypothetical protein
METKFIEGTNQQYSIREDGAVISHYFRKANKNKIYRDKILLPVCGFNTCTISINDERKKVSFQYLLHEYFGYRICSKCSNKIYSISKRICYDCYKQKQKKDAMITSLSIPKHLIAQQLKIPIALLTDELYQDCKTTLIIKRKLAKKLNTKPQYI